MFEVLMCNNSSFAYASKEVCVGIDRINRRRKDERKRKKVSKAQPSSKLFSSLILYIAGNKCE
jgi:hypothetical protein